jgi:mercuric ion transport protein
MSTSAEQLVTEPVPDQQTGNRWLALGGIVGAVASMSCCIVPLVFFALGVSGAWIGNLTALAPYQPLFVVFTLACLGLGFYRVYRKPQGVCVEGSYCAKPISKRIVKTALWCATVLVASALAFPYVTPWLLGV